MHISPTTLTLINSLRDCVRHDEGGGGQCASVVQELLQLPGFEDAYSTAGYFVTGEGNIIDDHWWLVMDDESILDPTQDQFGEGGFGDTVHLSKKDPRHEHYFPYSGEPGISVDVLQLADKIRARKRTTKNKTFADMAEAFGGRPVGDPNSQSAAALPDYVTDGGQEGIPQDPHDEEFKPEEFEDELRQHMTDDDTMPDAPMVAYHSTFPDNRESIAKHGLLKKYDQGTYDTDDPSLGAVFFSSGSTPDPNMDVWEIDLRGLPVEYDWVQVAGEAGWGENEHWWFTTQDIPSNRLKLVHKGDDMNEVDHPEFMPGGDETRGYDPNYDPQAQERAPNTNTGHSKP